MKCKINRKIHRYKANFKIVYFIYMHINIQYAYKTITEAIRHFSVAPYITICPSTETYFGHYLRGAMSEVTGIYIFRLLLNIIFFALRSFFTSTNSAYPDEMPHDGISPVCKCKKHVPKNIFHN